MDPDLKSDCALSEPYALQVLGPDMEPEFPDQCIVIIDPTDNCSDGAYVFIEIDDIRWFRQFREDESGNKWLAAVNPLFPDIELNGLEYKIHGVIIQSNIRRKVKKYKHHPNREQGTPLAKPLN